MTDKEFYNKLKELEPKMELFNSTRGGSLSIDDVNLIKSIYTKLVELSSGHINRNFNTSCSTCIRETFQILISVYYRLKEQQIN
jgi:hypothetical protein